MKKIILALSILVALNSCQNDDDLDAANNPVLTPGSTTSISTFMTNTNGLRVAEFIEDGVDKTVLFNAFVFTFSQNGQVTATGGGQSISGTYAVFTDDGRIELAMAFPNNSALNEFTDDWYFISQTQTNIRFQDAGDVVVFENL